jgi:tetratricopeptide (TPR) repeat protein
MGFTDIYFMRYSLVADHYQHLAVIGAIALAAAGWCAWRQRIPRAAQWKSIVVVIAALMALMFLTWRQNGDYRDTVSLYEATLEKNPNCWMAHNDLGGFLLHTGHADAAIEHLRLALQLKPDYLEAHNNLGMALDEIGRHHEAIEHLEKALGLKKRQAVVHYNLGNALVKSGRSREAIEHYEQALLLEPNYPEAHGNLGSALAQMGRLEEAIEHYQQALRQKPDFDAVYSNLVSVYVGLHRPDEAVATAQKALDIARSRGQAAQAKQIEDWLNSYRAELSAPPSTPH